jgi:hypothetical protein
MNDQDTPIIALADRSTQPAACECGCNCDCGPACACGPDSACKSACTCE